MWSRCCGVAGGAGASVREGGLRARRRTARPLHLLRAETGGRGRLGYVPAALVEVVRARWYRPEVEAVVAEISAINAELLARRELR